MNIIYTTSLFFICASVSCIKPRWQRISQDEGKAIAVTWKFNENERLVDCAVHRNISNEVFAVMKGTRVTSFNDFTTMIYGSDISFLVKPFNSSIHFGNYQLHINTTNGLDVFHYDVGFQLALKTADDLKDELLKEIKEGEGELELQMILIIVAAAVLFCIIAMVILICYRKKYIAESQIEQKSDQDSKTKTED